MSGTGRRDVEVDLQQLASRMRSDLQFANEVYCALSNVKWHHTDGTAGRSMSWRYAAGLVASLRGFGEQYYDFYCTRACEEGTISERVAAAMAELGWSGVGRGNRAVYSVGPDGEKTVWVNGDWVAVDEAIQEHPELFTIGATTDQETP